MSVNLEHGYIFRTTHDNFRAGKKVIVHKGGTGSGKTYDLMLFLLAIAYLYKDKIITVVSESKPHLDIGAIRILRSILIKNGMYRDEDYNKSTSVWTCRQTGSVIEFFSADRIDKALGARRFLLFGNEVNSLKFEVFDELARRSEFVLMDFNPTQQFWLEKFLQYYEDHVVITSNYTHNPFLPDTERQRIEKRAAMDSNFRRIHIDCEYGSYEGLVFNAFNIIEQLPEGIDYTYGLDWGYSNDPTALVKIGIRGDDLFIDEQLYRTGLTNADLTGMLPGFGIRARYEEIVADSAEPKSIEDLRRAGFNIKPAAKGPDSIRAGIDMIKQHHIHVTARSVNVIKELRNYSWVMDKAGQPTNKPMDVFNHGLDAVRYAVMARAKKIQGWAV